MRSIALFARRTLSIPTVEGFLPLIMRGGWRFSIHHDDGIDRARCFAASRWLLSTDDDVLVMVDDDVVFTPEDIERLADQCKPGFEIVCGDYEVHNGERRASTILVGEPPSNGLYALKYGAGGCMAIHRSVLEDLAKELPLCHRLLPIAFWPFFLPMLEELDDDCLYLTEDYAFSARARAAGKHIWLDAGVKVGHLSTVNITPDNGSKIHAITGLQW